MSLVIVDMEDQLSSPLRYTPSQSSLTSGAYLLFRSEPSRLRKRSVLAMAALLACMLSPAAVSNVFARDGLPKASESSKGPQATPHITSTHHLSGPTFKRVKTPTKSTLFHAEFKLTTSERGAKKDQVLPRYTVVKLDAPPRVVVDVIDADISEVTGSLEPLNMAPKFDLRICVQTLGPQFLLVANGLLTLCGPMGPV